MATGVFRRRWRQPPSYAVDPVRYGEFAPLPGWSSQDLASLLQFSEPSGAHSLPVADDATLDQAQKQHLLDLYSGILVGGAVQSVLDYERGFSRGYSRGMAAGAN